MPLTVVVAVPVQVCTMHAMPGARARRPVPGQTFGIATPPGGAAPHAMLHAARAMDVEGTQKILAASRKTGKIVQVGHQKRHGLAYRHAREIVSNKKEFGNVIQIESKMHGFTVFPTFWTCMLEWQCHNLDTVISFGGEITEV